MANASYDEVPEFAKARLVVVGCFEKDQNIRNDSPTGSTLGFYIVCSKCASRKWRLRLLDAHNAFLQSGELERLLILTPPYPLPPDVEKGSIFIAKGFLYGTRDAGRGWWLELKSVMIETGWSASRLELALWYLYEYDVSHETGVR